ncbi:MAG TPA: hypothetical protein VH158_07165 [Gemmatimonadales bacterium]|nr:hypothetical protein [Gemmatimonadales bacterium]
MRWAQPLPLALFGEESFGEVHTLFQLTESLLQFTEFDEPGLQVVQRLTVLARELAGTATPG